MTPAEADNAAGNRRRDWRRVRSRLAAWARRHNLARRLAVLLALAALASGVATMLALIPGPTGGSATTVLILLYTDLVLLLLLALLVARRIVRIWMERRRGGAGSRLHGRMVLLFSAVAAAPTIIVVVFSAFFVHLGLESWFSERVRTALEESLAVARAYLEEHQQVIVGDALAMANDINRDGGSLMHAPRLLSKLVATQAALRGLTEAVVFEGNGHVLARSGFSFSIEMSIADVPLWAFERAREGEVAVLTTENDDRVRALVQLGGNFVDTFLYVGRYVDPQVIGHMERTSAAVAEYQRLEGRRSGLEVTFSLIFLMVALLLLLVAIWVGVALATHLARPIVQLIDAAERVRAGDLTARVPERATRDELSLLSRAFNRMASQVDSQRRELIDANRELDERRRFTEAVLAGVTAGVIGLDAEGRIHLPNRSACDLLDTPPEAMVGRPLTEVVPEFAEHLQAVLQRPERQVQAEVRLVRDETVKTLLVRIVAERTEAGVVGHVVTFDDITDLQAAQRKAAWADVARRIAHEIKNPLTPIHLSAERLKRKYLRQVAEDRETFTACTDTIIRQVGDIRRMVDEFSVFARMPAPQMRAEDLRDIVAQTVFLHRTSQPDVRFDAETPEEPVPLLCDGRLLGQALTNVINNAVEAIQARGEAAEKGRVTVRLRREGEHVVLEVMDNGRGLPGELRDRLTEPYVTTRAKGTGLGLAIVKKIVEDHGGDLVLEDRPEGGARVAFVLPGGEGAAQTGMRGASAETGHGA